MTQAPATPELVERLKGLLVEEDRMHPLGCATWIEEVCVTVEEAADALEAQQARIAELEAVLRSARETILGLKNSRWSEAEGSDEEWVEDIDQALSSQGRHEGEQDSSSRSQPCADAQERSPGSLHSGGIDDDCPHAGTFRYCAECPVSPCPLGLGRGDNQ